MDDLIATQEREQLARLADEYRVAGYTVALEPSGAALPGGLPYEPDMIAVRGDDRIAIEVRHARRTSDRERWSALASALDRIGWRLRLVVIGGDERSTGDYATTPRQQIADQLERAEQLATTAVDAALLIAWAGFEAAARRALLIREHASTRPTNPTALVKQLVHHGLLDETDLKDVTRVAERRNSVAHGIPAAGLDVADVTRLTALGRQLLAAV